MILLYLSIPFMLVGLSVALIPLLWAMREEHRYRETTATATATATAASSSSSTAAAIRRRSDPTTGRGALAA